MKRFAALALAVALAGCTSTDVVAKRAPPQEREEARDPKPGGDYFWMKGRWLYTPSTDDYSWHPGHWEKERTNRVWIPGYWAPRGDVWVWHEEAWEERGNR